jgi:hypothetical protein
MAENVDIDEPSQRSSSPVFPSQMTIEPSGMTTGPSGNPRFEASSVPSTVICPFSVGVRLV